ncbi:MAG: Na(+)/H(+) antiporter subunit D [Proteobacteria bacterium]|nr:Na(+)/H(+) antiporter subunit D [Pseudomonadota bacterium]
MTMIDQLPPGLILIIGALLVPLLQGRVRAAYMLLLPVLCGWQVWQLAPGEFGTLALFDQTLVMMRVDGLSLVFGGIFTLAVFLSVIYALHVRDTVQQVAGLSYGGAAICAAFAGDLVTLFVFWELTAITSVFLIWATRSERAFKTGMRYLVIQVTSGVLLLAGTLMIVNDTGSIAFNYIGIDSLGGKVILLSFGIKAAFPLLHNWLQDSYPEATVTGTVFLSAFTTKLAIYALARGFPGTEMLIWIGATMAVFPIFFALVENDLRRLLAYSLNQQLGFMVVGVGIGTELALNGAVTHAVASVLYKALLFMAVGAVLFRTGSANGSDLGGLYKSMPWTAGFCLIGAASISALPLFSGFVTKSMILTAAAEEGHGVVWGILLLSSIGAVLHSGIRIPYVAFFAHDSGTRVKEAPVGMLVAMGLSAFLCVYIGVNPGPLYEILPFPVTYVPYTTAHVVNQLQLVMFAALAFAILIRYGLFPRDIRSTILDTDWVYRRLLSRTIGAFVACLADARDECVRWRDRFLDFVLERIFHYHGPRGIMARTWAISGAAIWVMVLLGGYLLVYYV